MSKSRGHPNCFDHYYQIAWVAYFYWFEAEKKGMREL